ncbi:hypothetical protein V2J09_018702 [Rumex salicifolius]
MSKCERQQNADEINLVVIDQDGNNTYFRLERNTLLKKMFKSYNLKHNHDDGVVTFLYNGHRISAQDTPAKLGMEEGDKIDCMEHKLGGSPITTNP